MKYNHSNSFGSIAWVCTSPSQSQSTSTYVTFAIRSFVRRNAVSSLHFPCFFCSDVNNRARISNGQGQNECISSYNFYFIGEFPIGNSF